MAGGLDQRAGSSGSFLYDDRRAEYLFIMVRGIRDVLRTPTGTSGCIPTHPHPETHGPVWAAPVIPEDVASPLKNAPTRPFEFRICA